VFNPLIVTRGFAGYTELHFARILPPTPRLWRTGRQLSAAMRKFAKPESPDPPSLFQALADM